MSWSDPVFLVTFGLAVVSALAMFWTIWFEHRRRKGWERLKAMERRAMAATVRTPGQLFDFQATLRRAIAYRILTGEDPPG